MSLHRPRVADIFRQILAGRSLAYCCFCCSPIASSSLLLSINGKHNRCALEARRDKSEKNFNNLFAKFAVALFAKSKPIEFRRLSTEETVKKTRDKGMEIKNESKSKNSNNKTKLSTRISRLVEFIRDFNSPRRHN